MDEERAKQESLESCCCKSCFPVVDITQLFLNRSPETSTQLLPDLINAFHFGAFNITINTEHLSSEFSQLVQLTDTEYVVKKLEKLFEENFLSTISPRGTDISVGTTKVTHTDNNLASINSIYRGRHSESGSTKGDGEPKQSWESFFCTQSNPAPPQSSFTVDDRLCILNSITKSLHDIAEKIFDVLDLPDFVSHGRCFCKNESSECSIDLLRVFRYDTVEHDQRINRLGSNEHTDWGSLTVVWQDSIGGLQIYCHKHGHWNDVVPIQDEKDNLHLFIHVGDFTSLSISGAVSQEMENGIVWPSPLHRVVCPDAKMSHESVRYSLVFFAYPRPGFSLNDAMKCIKESKTNGFIMKDTHMMKIPAFPYDRFMVLRDQSVVDEVSNELCLERGRLAYEKIRDQPFNDVIKNKWKQVQRK
jgi:hypothetical protein